MQPPPFIIYALPRSRTFWLSKFLTYRNWMCGHDEVRHLRSLDDAKSWLNMPLTGTVETAAAPWWRTVQKLRPDINSVVVRRPVAEVFDSLVKCGMTATADLEATLRRLDRKLDQIIARVPGVLNVSYEDLNNQDVCARLFEHCTGMALDAEWWAKLAATNLQCNLAGLFRYYAGHTKQLNVVARMAEQDTLSDFAMRPVSSDAMTFQLETFNDWDRDVQDLMREHHKVCGQSPDNYAIKNWPFFRHLESCGALQIMTARSNGKMFGYLLTIVGPHPESLSGMCATHNAFYASPATPGLGTKLQRAALAPLKERGVTEVIFRAGIRGSGPTLGKLYRKLGAKEDGQMYSMEI